MPRYIGEGPHEMYHHTPDGKKWTHAGANGDSWDTLEEAKRHYHSQNNCGWADTPIGFICMVAAFLILLFLCH